MSEPSSADAVFCEALEKEPAEWAAFLDQACAGNEPLRHEVQSLLDAYQKVGRFLERPLVGTEIVADLRVRGQERFDPAAQSFITGTGLRQIGGTLVGRGFLKCSEENDFRL